MKKVRKLLSLMLLLCLALTSSGVTAFAAKEDPMVFIGGFVYDSDTGELFGGKAYVTIRVGDKNGEKVLDPATPEGSQPVELRVYISNGWWEYYLDKGVAYSFTVRSADYESVLLENIVCPAEWEDIIYQAPDARLKAKAQEEPAQISENVTPPADEQQTQTDDQSDQGTEQQINDTQQGGNTEDQGTQATTEEGLPGEEGSSGLVIVRPEDAEGETQDENAQGEGEEDSDETGESEEEPPSAPITYPEDETEIDPQSIVQTPALNIVSTMVADPADDVGTDEQADVDTLPVEVEGSPVDWISKPTDENVESALTAAPSLKEVAATVETLEYKIEWSAIENAASYHVKVTTDVDTDAVEIDNATVYETAYVLPDEKLEENGNYRVYVSAMVTTGGEEVESAAALAKFAYAPVAVEPDVVEGEEGEALSGIMNLMADFAAPEVATMAAALDVGTLAGETVTKPTVTKESGSASENVIVSWTTNITTANVASLKAEMRLYGDTTWSTAWTAASGTAPTSIGIPRVSSGTPIAGVFDVRIVYTLNDAASTVITSDETRFAIINGDYGEKTMYVREDNTVLATNPYNNSQYQTSYTLAKGAAVTVISQYNGYYMLKYNLGTNSSYAFVPTSALESNKMIAPTNLVVDTSGAYFVANWANGDTRNATYKVQLYASDATPPTTWTTVTGTKYTHTTSLAYGKTYIINVVAVANPADSSILDSDVTTISVPWTQPTSQLISPVLTGEILAGYLYHGVTGVSWTSVTNATSYDYIVYGADGSVIITSNTTSTSLPYSVFSNLDYQTAATSRPVYTLAVRARSTVSGTNPSAWVLHNFSMINPAETFISGFTMNYASGKVEAGTAVTFTLTGTVLPTSVTMVIVNASTGAETRVTVTPNTSTKQFTHTFSTAGTYLIYMENTGTLPNTQSKSLEVVTAGITITNASTFSPKNKSTAFTIEWNHLTNVTYYVTIEYADRTRVLDSSVVTTYPLAIANTVLTKIGAYAIRIDGVINGTSETITSGWLPFDVIDGSYTAKTGTVKAADTPVYMTAATTYPITYTLDKGATVSVIGELDSYYHVNIGTTASPIRVFVAKSALTVSSSSSSGGSSSGGSSSGSGSSGSSGTRPGASGGSISTTAYKEAFGSEALRKSSYAYILELYKPLMEAMEKGEVLGRTKMELLSTSFSPLPNELNGTQYDAVRGRAAWNMVEAYLTFFVTEAVTDGMSGQSSALPTLAGEVNDMITELLALQKSMDESTKLVLEKVQQKAQAIIGAASTDTLTGTKEEVALGAIKALFEDKPFDTEVDTKLVAAIQTAMKDPTIEGEEPLEVELMRVLYALVEYEQTRMNDLLSALESTALVSDINVVQDAYLDYAFAAAKLHQLAYAFGGASSDAVVQNYGAEVARLIAINKIYNTFAQ